MANDYMNIYKNNPTAGGTDGTVVSTNGSFTEPISFKLDASENETAVQKCAVRTESGYIATDVTISDNNDTNDRVKLSLTENGTFADTLSIGSVSAVNSIFYVKASSVDTENPQTDKSVSLKVSGVITLV